MMIFLPRRKTQKSRKGFSLTELAIVLLAVSFITSAVWVAAGRVWDNYRTTRTMSEIMTTVQNLRDATNARVWTTTLDITPSLDAMENPATNTYIFPFEMRRTPTAAPGSSPIDHMFSNDGAGSLQVWVEPSIAPPGPIESFRFRLFYLTTSACIRLLTAAPSNDDVIGMTRIGTLTGATYIVQGISPSMTLPVPPSMAESWCQGTGTTNEVDLDFKMRP